MGSDAMTTRPRRIQLAALLLAIATMNSGAFPRINPGFEPASPQSGLHEQDTTALVSSTVNSAQHCFPLTFAPNRGQAQAGVEFVGRADGFALLLKRNEAVLSLRKPLRTPARGAASNTPQPNWEPSAPHLLTMMLEGANATPNISGESRQEARANYFIGNDPAKWIRHVETYSRVSYSSVYQGIDLVFYGTDRQLEYDFTVAPGADPRAIRLRFEGADDVELDSKGALLLHTAAGPVRHDRPVAYQMSKGTRLGVPAEFRRLDDGTIGFIVDVSHY